MADVLVVGAGPVGLTLALELARHGVRCRIVDRLAEPLPYCRAIGVTPRTLEVWEDMGLAREMIEAGLWLTGLRSIIDGQPPRDAPAPVLDLPYGQLGLPQYETERVLTGRLARLGIAVERGLALAGLREETDGVAVRLRSGDGRAEETHLRYVVGCDGAHSDVRRLLGIAFEGEAYPWPFMLGDVHIAWDAPYGMAVRALRLVEDGPPAMLVAIPLPEPGRYRVSMLAPPHLVPPGGAGHGIQADLRGPSLPDIQAVADDLLPTRPRLSDLRWSSIYRISMRLAAAYRKGRCLIAGDAAHIHPPTGGQGMNTGIQDAYNLAWKLALVLRGIAPETLLDSYEAERRPVGEEVVARTRAASEGYGRERGAAADRLADTQVLVSYRGTAFVRDEAEDAPAAGPAAGDRAPDAGGLVEPGLGFPLRVFDLLRGTQHVLVVHLGRAGAQAVRDLSDWAVTLPAGTRPHLRVAAVTGDAPSGSVPGLTLVEDRSGAFAAAYGPAPTSYLVRPDGHIAWRGASWRGDGLAAYLTAYLAGAGA